MKFEENLLESLALGAVTALTGRLDGIEKDGRVRFRPDGREQTVPVVLGLTADDETVVRAALDGVRAIALRPENAGGQWVLTGLLRETVGVPDAGTGLEVPAARPDEAVIDGKTVRFEARDEIVLQCGKGSITLRKDGKIVIKGTHLLSRATGVHRIKGGSVDIN